MNPSISRTRKFRNESLAESTNAYNKKMRTPTTLTPANEQQHQPMNKSKENNNKSSDDNIMSNKTESNILQKVLCILYISIFSMIGVLIRICLGSFFSFCNDNDSNVSNNDSNEIRHVITNGVCLTNARDAVFVDLPANMLGSFLMGISQSAYVLGLASDLPVACFSSQSWLQSFDMLHIGWRTGYVMLT